MLKKKKSDIRLYLPTEQATKRQICTVQYDMMEYRG